MLNYALGRYLRADLRTWGGTYILNYVLGRCLRAKQRAWEGAYVLNYVGWLKPIGFYPPSLTAEN